jgi:hypothetical protein
MMAGVHEDEVGSQFWYKVYRLGSIIRDREFWGIVIRADRQQVPLRALRHHVVET